MNSLRLDSITTIQEIEEIPEAKGSLFRGNMRTETQMDEFDSAEESRIPVWLWTGENIGQTKALDIWKSEVSRTIAQECIRSQEKGSHILIVFRPGDGLLQPETLSEEEQAEFASVLSYACVLLCDAGLTYTRWSTSCVAKQGISWKILPMGDLRISETRDRAAAVATLGEWFRTLRLPLFRSEPALSIIKLMCQKKVPDAMYDDMGYQNFWYKLENIQSPVKVNVQNDGTSVKLDWDPSVGEVSFRTLGPQEIPPRGTLISRNSITKIGKDFCNHPKFRPVLNESEGTATWQIPTDNTRYECVHLLPLVEYDDWFQPGIPIQAGGPLDICILDAWYDSESQECVLSFNWDIDLNIRSLKILYRTDQYAETPNDVGEIPPARCYREPINHPFRKRILFQSVLYITVFSEVNQGGRLYYSPGLARASIVRPEEPDDVPPKKNMFW